MALTTESVTVTLLEECGRMIGDEEEAARSGRVRELQFCCGGRGSSSEKMCVNEQEIGGGAARVAVVVAVAAAAAGAKRGLRQEVQTRTLTIAPAGLRNTSVMGAHASCAALPQDLQ